MRSWWDRQVDHGWSPQGLPRGQVRVEFPLLSGVRYRVSMNPNKGHLLMPGTDHAYCGLTLAPEDDYLINSGYDAYYWVIEENRKGKVDCGDCTRWRDRWTRSAYADRGRPTERRSHLTEEQWADMDEAIIAKWKQFEMKARWVADQLGATIIEEAA